MKRIDGRVQSATGGRVDEGESAGEPWEPQASDEVRRLRSVITNRADAKGVSDEMAPMMSEFLARLDELSEPPPRLHQAPPLPDGDTPPTPAEQARDLRAAVRCIEDSELGGRLREDGPVARMVSEVKAFLRLRQACIARASNSAQ